MSEPLELVQRWIYGTRGASFEGDIFSILRHSPFALRGFEFALADGGVDCRREYKHTATWADRYWDYFSRRYGEDKSEVVLFDIKSTVQGAINEDSHSQGENHLRTTSGQRRHVAFYIGINAADPTFVDIFPNYRQEEIPLKKYDSQFTRGRDNSQFVSLCHTRVARLPPRAYKGLDQVTSPYRMPISLLCEAIKRIRDCALGHGPYINPWTQVVFTDWKPITTTCADFLRPGDDSDHATACEAAVEIYRLLRYDSKAQFEVDFVGLQPTLADFKLIEKSTGLQKLIQHKLDTRLRSLNTPMTNIPASRPASLAAGGRLRYYFAASDRFDFFWWQFKFSLGPPEVQTVIFFMPEKELPDKWFTSEIIMDQDGLWVRQIEKIVKDNPVARTEGQRPSRPKLAEEIPPEEDENEDVPVATEAKASKSWAPRTLYKEALRQGHRRFFYKIMDICAHKMSGLLIVLGTNHSFGDFGYMRYAWSKQEQQQYQRTRTPPLAGHQVPPDADMLFICYYTQHSESGFAGPMLSAPIFRRLDSDPQLRIVVWDIAGPDSTTLPLSFVPSDDIRASAAQNSTFQHNLQNNRDTRKTPTVSSLLNTGLWLSEYTVGGGSILSYEQDSWADAWSLLDHFTLSEPLQHPIGHYRDPKHYRGSMRAANQRLVLQQRHGVATGVDDDD